jgi:hypothetical protein
MWIVRFLSGPLAGQVTPLTKAQTLIGRSPSCDIKIPSSSVSKEHTRIEVFDDKIIVSDAGSRNGTFVNGVQVRSSKAKSGDKVAMHDVFFEIQNVPDAWASQFRGQQYAMYNGATARQQAPQMAPPQMHAHPQMPPQHHAMHGHGQMYAGQPQPGAEASSQSAIDLVNGKFPRWAVLAQEYMDRVVLPGFYRLPENFEFKFVIAGLMGAFVLLVTSLSTVPLVRILRASIEEESQQHAMTIATTLARVNRPALSQGMDTAINVDIATNRPGVKKAFIVSNLDGSVMAPAAQAGTYPNVPYMNEGRKLTKESVRQVDDNTVVAMVPIEFFNAETGSHAVTAWAVVMYDMSSLAVDNGQVISLFITMLFLSLLLGSIVYYLMFKLMEFPLLAINRQLDVALKEGHDTINVSYRFPALQDLASNVSSALNRASSGTENAGASKVMEHDRNREMANLVELIGFAAMGIRGDDLGIAAANSAFEARVGIPTPTLTTMNLNELNDQALKLSVQDLITRLDQNPDELATNALEFSGANFQVVAQAVFGTAKIAYYLIVLLPAEGGG